MAYFDEIALMNAKGVKLSKRLECIKSMILGANVEHHGLENQEINSQHYDHIWDCCCDHGLLGRSLLSAYASRPQLSATIHFVDVVRPLIQTWRSLIVPGWHRETRALPVCFP